MSQSTAPEESGGAIAVVASDGVQDLKTQSRPKGAYQSSWGGTWFSQIMHNGKRIYLGSFDTEEEAAEAYQSAHHRLKGGTV